MKREIFKQFVEQTLENVIQYAEEKTGKSLSRDIAFGWFYTKESELVRKDIDEYITQRVYIDENNIFPCVDIGVADILNDGTTLIWANVSGHNPRPFEKNWTGRDGPFVYIIGQKLIDKLPVKRMNLPYYLFCSERGTNLYQLKDGRFQIITKGKIVPLMVGSGYALVEVNFAEYLEQLDLPGFDIADAIIYDPAQKVEIRTHRQLKIEQQFSVDMMRDLNLVGEQIFLMNNTYIFVSPQLKKRLEETEFQYLRFRKGLSEFA